jgi:hypothetical protein
MQVEEDDNQTEVNIHGIPLKQIFEGDTLLHLEELGVETFNASEVETNVINLNNKKFQELQEVSIIILFS